MIAQTAQRLISMASPRGWAFSGNWADQVTAPAQRFTAWFATSRKDILRAQRFRYQIFRAEYGDGVKGLLGLDRDRFDKVCQHLLVRDNQTGRLVGYTRVLQQEAAQRLGGFYSGHEFELDSLRMLPGRVAEIGRTCIHPDYRSGAVIGVLWSTLSRQMAEQGVDFLIGCASVGLGGEYSLSHIRQQVAERSREWIPDAVVPRQVYTGSDRAEPSRRLPPLLKAYLRMGAEVAAQPCWDPAFRCVDFFILMPVSRLPARYLQHFAASSREESCSTQ